MRIFIKLLMQAISLYVFVECKSERGDVRIDNNDFVPKSFRVESTVKDTAQLVHPDILVRNNMFYMAVTPYPNRGNDKYENPCIYISKDGRNFIESFPNANPIVPKPLYDHNDDPDIIFNESDNCFYIHYLETMRPDSQNLISLRSVDLKKWEKKTLIHFNLKKREPFIVSPSFIKHENQYYMFYVDLSKKGNSILFRSSSDLQNFEQTSAKKINIKLDSFHPWHLDVLTYNGNYYMLLDAYLDEFNNNKHSLLLYRSDDLLNWVYIDELISKSKPPISDFSYVYRSTGYIENNNLKVIYSFTSLDLKWHLGILNYKL